MLRSAPTQWLRVSVRRHPLTNASATGAGITKQATTLATLGPITLLDAGLASGLQSSLQRLKNPNAVLVDQTNNTAVFGTESRIADLLRALHENDDASETSTSLVAKSPDGRALLSDNTRLRDLARDAIVGEDPVLFQVNSLTSGEHENVPLLVKRPPAETLLSAVLLPERIQHRRDELHAKKDELCASIQELESTQVCVFIRLFWSRGFAVHING
jgi:hypothetical protein